MPDRCLTRIRVVKQVIRMSVAIEVGCCDQLPIRGKRRPKCSSDESASGQVSDHGLASSRNEHNNVHLAVAVKIGNVRQVPSCRKGGQQRSANDNVVVEIKYYSQPSGAIENHKVRIVVAVKIRCRYQLPRRGQNRSSSSSDQAPSRQIPECRLKCVCREQREIWMRVKIEIR